MKVPFHTLLFTTLLLLVSCQARSPLLGEWEAVTPNYLADMKITADKIIYEDGETLKYQDEGDSIYLPEKQTTWSYSIENGTLTLSSDNANRTYLRK